MQTPDAPDPVLDAGAMDPAPRSAPGILAADLQRVRALAAEIDCVVTEDLCALAGIKPGTAEAWAKRGEGPAYVMFGNRRLYPRAAIRKYCADRLKDRGFDVRGLL